MIDDKEDPRSGNADHDVSRDDPEGPSEIGVFGDDADSEDSEPLIDHPVVGESRFTDGPDLNDAPRLGGDPHLDAGPRLIDDHGEGLHDEDDFDNIFKDAPDTNKIKDTNKNKRRLSRLSKKRGSPESSPHESASPESGLVAVDLKELDLEAADLGKSVNGENKSKLHALREFKPLAKLILAAMVAALFIAAALLFFGKTLTTTPIPLQTSQSPAPAMGEPALSEDVETAEASSPPSESPKPAEASEATQSDQASESADGALADKSQQSPEVAKDDGADENIQSADAADGAEAELPPPSSQFAEIIETDITASNALPEDDDDWTMDLTPQPSHYGQWDFAPEEPPSEPAQVAQASEPSANEPSAPRGVIGFPADDLNAPAPSPNDGFASALSGAWEAGVVERADDAQSEMAADVADARAALSADLPVSGVSTALAETESAPQASTDNAAASAQASSDDAAASPQASFDDAAASTQASSEKDDVEALSAVTTDYSSVSERLGITRSEPIAPVEPATAANELVLLTDESREEYDQARGLPEGEIEDAQYAALDDASEASEPSEPIVSNAALDSPEPLISSDSDEAPEPSSASDSTPASTSPELTSASDSASLSDSTEAAQSPETEQRSTITRLQPQASLVASSETSEAASRLTETAPSSIEPGASETPSATPEAAVTAATAEPKPESTPEAAATTAAPKPEPTQEVAATTAPATPQSTPAAAEPNESPAAPSAPAVETEIANVWVANIFSSPSQQEADRAWARLSGKSGSNNLYRYETTLDGVTTHRIRVGFFDDRSAAQAAGEALVAAAALGTIPWVVQPNVSEARKYNTQTISNLWVVNLSSTPDEAESQAIWRVLEGGSGTMARLQDRRAPGLSSLSLYRYEITVDDRKQYRIRLGFFENRQAAEEAGRLLVEAVALPESRIGKPWAVRPSFGEAATYKK